MYLLDGQQRTTALTLALTDKHIYKGNNVRKKEDKFEEFIILRTKLIYDKIEELC